ncbi:MAG: TIGR04283 family arsenosugar biosynthesis glycosyltransferase [Armatimonadaceae bacterium]
MRLSIIIPTWNEEAALPETLKAAKRTCPSAEVLVVDGGSTDGTVQIAKSEGMSVVRSERGRGRQQNAGAEAATGNILLFLHADTLLPEGTEAALTTVFFLPTIVGGNFRLRFSPSGFWNDSFARIYNFRSRTARHYYGDSCLFVRTSVFQELGGFREGMLMEDWEFIQRLEIQCRATGTRTLLLPLTVQTSARRFSGKRRWRYVYLWCYLHYLHARGVSGDELARMYPDVR